MTSATSPRGMYAKTPERRAEILDVALEVFGGSGFWAGSLREIADRAGMSQAGLLHHFGSKAGLLAAVLDRRDEVNRSFFDLTTTDGMAYLRGLLRLVAHNCANPGIVELYCQLSAEATAVDHPAHDYFVARYARINRNIAEALRDVEAQGYLTPGSDPASLGRQVFALFDGLQTQWIYADHSFDMTELLRGFLNQHLTVAL